MKNISEHIDSLIVHKNKNKNNKSLKKYKNYLKNTNKKVKNKKVKKTKKIQISPSKKVTLKKKAELKSNIKPSSIKKNRLK